MLRWCFLAAHFLLKIVGVGFPGPCETVKRRSRVDLLDHIRCELIVKRVSGETPGGIFT
jgi:hypothetical protein